MKSGSKKKDLLKADSSDIIIYSRKMHYPPEETSILLVLRIFAMLKINPELSSDLSDFCDSTVNEVTIMTLE